MLKHLKSSDSWQEKSIGAKGFTLIELLVVIVILGVLGAVVIFSVRGVNNNSKESSCRTEKRTLGTAIEAYYAQNNAYAADTAALAAAGFLRDANTYGYQVSGANITGTCPP